MIRLAIIFDSDLAIAENLFDEAELRYDIDNGGRYIIRESDAEKATDILSRAGIEYDVI